MAKKSSAVVENNRSAKTGRFVTEKYAKAHPSTTVTENNKKPSGSSKKASSGKK